MNRPVSILLIGLGLLCGLSANTPASTTPDAATLSKECYAGKVGQLLQSSGGKLTPEVRNAYVDWAEKTVLQELRESGLTVAQKTLAEVRQDATLRDAIFGSVFPPDPSILQNYAQLRAQLGENFNSKYRSLAIAISVARRVKGVEKSIELKDVGHDYQPGFWTDESLRVPGSDAEKQFVQRIADFMKKSQVSALDLYQNTSTQQQMRTVLAQQGVSSGFIEEVKKSVGFGERLKYALVVLDQRPAARAAKPAIIEWMQHLVAIEEAAPSSTPESNGRPMPWPLFPAERAPWPLLMPLAHAVPLGEANYIWEAFQGGHGPDRYHTYGPYRGDDDVMPDSLRPSTWFWDAWPDRILHGGCAFPYQRELSISTRRWVSRRCGPGSLGTPILSRSSMWMEDGQRRSSRPSPAAPM